jgi:hypothetical protein
MLHTHNEKTSNDLFLVTGSSEVDDSSLLITKNRVAFYPVATNQSMPAIPKSMDSIHQVPIQTFAYWHIALGQMYGEHGKSLILS